MGITGLICKIIAVLYRIPLAWLIGDQGLGTYQLVFPTYNLLLTISSAGLPVAISRIVSYNLAKGDVGNTRRTFQHALIILSIVGIVGTLLMIALRTFLSDRVGDPLTVAGFVAIAPSVAIVCTMSAFRGYMQGQQDMKPTAISQLIEQVGKIIDRAAVGLSGLQNRHGRRGGINIGYAAAGALLGTSVSEAVCAFVYVFRLLPQAACVGYGAAKTDETPLLRWRQINRNLYRPRHSHHHRRMHHSFGVVYRFRHDRHRLVDGAGFLRDDARAMYGRFSGYVITLINVPTAISLAISMSMVPAISANVARGDEAAVTRSTYAGLRMAFLIGLPCSFGMSVLAKPILAMVYPFSSPEALAPNCAATVVFRVYGDPVHRCAGDERYSPRLAQAENTHVYAAGRCFLQGADQLYIDRHAGHQHSGRVHRLAGVLRCQHGAKPVLCTQAYGAQMGSVEHIRETSVRVRY